MNYGRIPSQAVIGQATVASHETTKILGDKCTEIQKYSEEA